MSSMLTKISDINVSLQTFQGPSLFFLAAISFCGSSCPLHLQRFGNRSLGLSTQPFRKQAKRKRVQESRTNKFIEYCESSQRAMTFSVVLYSSFVGKLISPAVLVAVPYFFEMACTMSSAVSPCVAS